MNLMTKGFGEFGVLGRQASAFLRPARGTAALGAALGTGAGYATSNDQRGGAIKGALAGGALAGLYGMGYAKTFMRAGSTGGIQGGLSAVGARMSGRWKNLGRLARAL